VGAQQARCVVSVLQQMWTWLIDPANWSGDEGIPSLAGQQVRISVYAMLLASAIALPPAIWLGHARKGGAIASNIGNIGRAIPTLGILIMFAVSPVGVTELAVVLALAVFAVPPLLTNTFVAMRDVDDEVRDAARGMGMRRRQMIGKVELPLALPLIAAGYRTATVQVMATATLAAFIGAGTLGLPVLVGFGLQDNGELFGAALCVAVLCISTEGVMAVVQRLLTPKALRRGVETRRAQRVPDREPSIDEEAVAH